MININNKETSAVYYGTRIITAVYAGAKLVWSAVSSCFGSGFWRSERPWSRTDGWKRNP